MSFTETPKKAMDSFQKLITVLMEKEAIGIDEAIAIIFN